MGRLYLVELTSKQDPAAADPLLDRLDPDRRRAVSAMCHPGARLQSLCGHLLVRSAACDALGVPNPALRFGMGEGGKPVLTSHPHLHFSIAHTAAAVAVALAGEPVGVDVEALRPADLRIARRFFTLAEQRYIDAGGPEQDLRFFQVWTRKEACVKWMGGSLAKSLQTLDALSPPWSVRVLTLRRGDLLLSVCGLEIVDEKDLRMLSFPAFLDMAETLAPIS